MRDPGDRPYGELHAQLIAGGKSNLTYRVTDGVHDWVVRRPPLGHVLATAHDMAREHRVMSALAATTVPVPEMVALCEDPAVMGVPFYVMQYVEGAVLRRRPSRRTSRAASAPTSRTGWSTPSPTCTRWTRPRWASPTSATPRGSSSGRSGAGPPSWSGPARARCPASPSSPRALAARVPRSQRASIVHGDYRLDNVLIGEDQQIRAVLDWEMATLGDPLCDLGLLPVYATPAAGVAGVVSDGMGPHNGFPSMDALVERYAARTGLDVTPLPWYIALGYYKLAVICEGIHARHLAGQTVGPGFDRIGELVPPLVAAGSAALG